MTPHDGYPEQHRPGTSTREDAGRGGVGEPWVPGSRMGDLAEGLARHARDARHDVTAALAVPDAFPAAFPLPGGGDTATLWHALAVLGATDLTVARAVEPHVDATAVLAEARRAGFDVPQVAAGERWGVFAAEGPGARLTATGTGGSGDEGGVHLDGVKPWCSLAGILSHALVTAWVDDRRRRLFAVVLDDATRSVEDVPWVARGLSGIPSGPVRFASAPARPVGGPGWYLDRPGFAWGGIGVAAVWYGGACGLVRRLAEQAARREPDQVALAHLGACDAALHAAAATLGHAALAVDAGEATGRAGEVLALRVRHVVARAAEEVQRRVDHALGPGPLALEEEHAARVADLHLYVRQEHAERDEAALGRALLAGGTS